MSQDSDWAEDNEVPLWSSIAIPRAAQITAVAPLDPFNNIGFSVTLGDVEDPYEVSLDKWKALGAQIGGYLVFREDAETVSYQSAEDWEADHDLVVE